MTRRPSASLSRTIVALLAFFVLARTPATLGQDPGSGSQPAVGSEPDLLALAADYRALDAYRDEGTIEITTFEDGTERTTWILFATRLAATGFQMELWPESGSQTVLWTRGRPHHHPETATAERRSEVFRYDALAKRFARLPSFRDALPRFLGPAVREALLVPGWLLGEPDPLDPPGAPEVETGQPCGGETPQASDPASASPPTCRILTWTSPPDRSPERRLRLWLGETDRRVRRVEVERGPPAPAASRDDEDAPVAGLAPSRAWTWVKVVHTPLDPDPDAMPFLPPPDARRVARLPQTASPESPTGAAGSAGTFSESIQVFELLLPVQVIDRDGDPLPGLTAEDFRLRVGGEEVPIQAATWRDPRDPWIAELAQMSDAERRELGIERVVPGRLVVLFFQTDFNAVRIKGHMAFLPRIRDLLASLAPTDRVALASFDSHLKLWHDFTTDRQAILDLVEDAFRFGADPGPVRPGDVSESLAEGLDLAAARDAVFVEQGLALLARAMEPFVADKVLLFVGWGVGHNGVQPLREGYRALFDAGVTLHALDVTYVDGIGPAHPGHTLAAPLSAMAQTTGGTYVATHMFPGFAVQAVAVALQGHYELSVRESDVPPTGGRIRIELRDPKKGEIYNPGGIPFIGPVAGGDE